MLCSSQPCDSQLPRRRALRPTCRRMIGFFLPVTAIPSYPTTCEKDQRRAPVKAVCGQVHDLYDVALTGAEISLLRGDGSVLAKLTTHDGKFDFSSVLKGDYLLRVERSGFPIEERRITVVRDRIMRCKSTIRVKLSPLSCASLVKIKGSTTEGHHITAS